MSNPLQQVPYVPSPVPQDPKFLVEYLRRELTRIAESINSIQSKGANGQFVPILDTSLLAAAAGGASPLPGDPEGYVKVMLDGYELAIPFWNP